MNKPKKHTTSYYDYHECCHYLEQKYGYEERDYAGQNNYYDKARKKVTELYGDKWYNTSPSKYTPEMKKASDLYEELLKSKPEYQDFWHWVIDIYEINNGCYFYMSNEQLPLCEFDWQKEILERYLSEFGTGASREIKFWVSW